MRGPNAPGGPGARAVDLSPDMVRRVQQALSREGYRVDPIDGVWGPGTAQAVRHYQRDRGLTISGRPDPDTLARLGVVTDGSRVVPPGQATNQPPPIRQRRPADLDPMTIRALQQALARQGFRTGAADGIWGAQTESAIGNFQRARGMPASGVPDAPTLAALGLLPGGDAMRARADGQPLGPADLDPAAVRMIQQALNDRGFSSGTADGTWGDRTTTALRDFQRSQGIEPTGDPDIYTLSALDLLPRRHRGR